MGWIGYKYLKVLVIGDVDRMKKVWVLSFFYGLLVMLMIMGTAHAQKQPKTLTILYTNNINGEIDPCPS
jgi:hypothetical protein